jgi:hypothetical protein
MITMKKLALAATVGLSLSILAAGPASAAGLDGSTAASESSSAAQTSASADPADSDLDKGSLALKYTYMTPTEVTNDPGIRYTIDGLKKGDVVSTDLNGEEKTAERDGVFDGSAVLDSAPETDSTVDFTVSVKRGGKTVAELPASVKIIEGDRGDYERGTLLLGEDKMTVDEFKENGQNMSMVNCSADDKVNFEVFAERAGEYLLIAGWDQIAGEDDKSASVRYMPFDEDKYLPGEYTVKAQCGDSTAKEKFTVTD